MRLIAFDGISGSGKTTLYEEVRKYVGQTNLIVHRFTPTMWVYDKLYGRNQVNTAELINWERLMKPILQPLIVWSICSPGIAEERKRLAGDTNVEPDFEKAQMLYWEYITNYCQFDVVRVRTDQMTVAECGWEILKEVKCQGY